MRDLALVRANAMGPISQAARESTVAEPLPNVAVPRPGVASPRPSASLVSPKPAPLHPISRRHLDALTGELGIFQHAIGSSPDPEHGYCVDDVARALEVDVLHARTLGWDAVAESARRNLRFLEDAFDEESGRFQNFRSIDGSWIGGPGSHDSLGRAMLALGETIAAAPDPELVARALVLFERSLPAARRLTSPRSQASVVLACACVANSAAVTAPASEEDVAIGIAAHALMRAKATDLHARFLWLAGPGWPWLEESLTYENAVIPRAIIVAGQRLGAAAMLAIGLQVLNWLIDTQTAPAGHLSPIGNGWWERGGEKSQFDQQPIEATAILLAAHAAHRVTGDTRYVAAMERAYGWFLGRNDLGVWIADPMRGAGSDGLTPDGMNVNEGAESTLMWLVAAEHIRAIRPPARASRAVGRPVPLTPPRTAALVAPAAAAGAAAGSAG